MRIDPGCEDMKQFKVRIEGLRTDWHAIEIWICGENIVEVAQEVLQQFAPLGIEPRHIVKLIELDTQ